MLEQLIQSALQGLAGSQGLSGNQSGMTGMSPLLQVAAALLNNNGQFGGLQGLIQQFQQAGFDSHMNSWISTGQNLPISPDQLTQIFGAGRMQQMAQQAGMDPQSMSGQLSQLLPQMIDRLTPQGSVPSGGLEDALGSLARLVR
ncbi:MAG TPA: YidB family protein [Burkholderiaceae bacterium]|nr:YidB family protein [Burkholderiaceae bacterium]